MSMRTQAIEIRTPVERDAIASLRVGDRVLISGKIYTGRDSVLPKLVELYRNGGLASQGIDLKGSVIFHTAVSPAGVGPTSSNKPEIMDSIPALSGAGVRVHLGKGRVSAEVIKALDEQGSVYAVMPPVTALLESKTKGRRIVLFEEYGMEAMHELDVCGYPAIIAAAHGESIFDE